MSQIPPCENVSNFLTFPAVSPAAERLRYILSEDDDMPTPTLFTEMDTLQREGDELEWKESARWVKLSRPIRRRQRAFLQEDAPTGPTGLTGATHNIRMISRHSSPLS